MVSEVEKIKVRTIAVPKFPMKSIILMSLGGLFLVTGVLFILSIILILPGIFGVFIGVFILYVGVPAVGIDCLACGQTVNAKMNAKSAVCKHCKTVNPVVWTKK